MDCKGVVSYLPDSVRSVSDLWSKINPCLTRLKRIWEFLLAENEENEWNVENGIRFNILRLYNQGDKQKEPWL